MRAFVLSCAACVANTRRVQASPELLGDQTSPQTIGQVGVRSTLDKLALLLSAFNNAAVGQQIGGHISNSVTRGCTGPGCSAVLRRSANNDGGPSRVFTERSVLDTSRRSAIQSLAALALLSGAPESAKALSIGNPFANPKAKVLRTTDPAYKEAVDEIERFSLREVSRITSLTESDLAKGVKLESTDMRMAEKKIRMALYKNLAKAYMNGQRDNFVLEELTDSNVKDAVVNFESMALREEARYVGVPESALKVGLNLDDSARRIELFKDLIRTYKRRKDFKDKQAGETA